MLEEEATEYVSKEEVSEAIKIKQMELQFEREIREKEMQLQKKIKERELESRIFIEKGKLQPFDVTKHIRFVPPFNETEADKYFPVFEKEAKDLDWPLNKYILSKNEKVTFRIFATKFSKLDIRQGFFFFLH